MFSRHLSYLTALAGRVDESPASDPLLSALVADAHAAAALTAVIMSAVDALACGLLRDPRVLADFLPHEPAALRAGRRWLSASEVAPCAMDAVTRFYAGLAPARAAVSAFRADAAALGTARAIVVHRHRLVAIWRLMCQEARAVVQSLGALPGANSNPSTAELLALLDAAASGRMPCLDAAGQPALPGFMQRRSAARRALGEGCLVHARGGRVEALARDVSSGGLGLENAGPLARGDSIMVELHSGRCFSGTVAWCRGAAAGVKFTKPLLPNDPLLFG